MNRITKQLCVAGVSAFAFSLNAQAAITFVDAAEGSLGNTFATGGSLADTSWQTTADSANSGSTWRSRSTFGEGGTIFEGGYSGSADPELTTQITGLADGTYDVFVFFWDATGSNAWDIGAGLTSGSLDTYSYDGAGDTITAVAASTLLYSAAPMFTEGDRIMYAVNIGQATVAGGSGVIDVFVDSGGTVSTAARTWYDGVGYEAVPEPSSTALLGLGGLALILRRRRQA